ncbi:MAG TPA: hypothetical protein VEI97_19250, partial [bacterium]|nr:hypothetical protein [bacterium]
AWPMAHTDFLHHAVYLEVPEDKVDDLAMFDGSVWVERTEGLLNAKCDLEVNNIIALNVAYDVAMGKRTVEDARAFFTQTAMDAKNGKLNDYSRGLIFEPQSKAAAHYPDSPQM